ncbi:MAG: hypothetical protein PHC94_03245 [Methylobacter sp.]|nr:hypothetical protein [Methylobacter sp.]
MFNFDPDYDHDKYRKAKFSEADEDRENPTFIAWDQLSNMHLAEVHAKLNDICKRVIAGDRNSMLELIEITADELLLFDTLSLELRANLSDGLKEIGNVLRLSRGKKGFLPPLPPRGSGVLSEEKKRDNENRALLTARRVEYYRFHGLTLEDAKAKVAEIYDQKEDSVHDHWKKAHRLAKPLFMAITMAYNAVEKVTGVNPDPNRQNKKVR